MSSMPDLCSCVPVHKIHCETANSCGPQHGMRWVAAAMPPPSSSHCISWALPHSLCPATPRLQCGAWRSALQQAQPHGRADRSDTIMPGMPLGCASAMATDPRCVAQQSQIHAGLGLLDGRTQAQPRLHLEHANSSSGGGMPCSMLMPDLDELPMAGGGAAAASPWGRMACSCSATCVCAGAAGSGIDARE